MPQASISITPQQSGAIATPETSAAYWHQPRAQSIAMKLHKTLASHENLKTKHHNISTPYSLEQTTRPFQASNTKNYEEHGSACPSHKQYTQSTIDTFAPKPDCDRDQAGAFAQQPTTRKLPSFPARLTAGKRVRGDHRRPTPGKISFDNVSLSIAVPYHLGPPLHVCTFTGTRQHNLRTHKHAHRANCRTRPASTDCPRSQTPGTFLRRVGVGSEPSVSTPGNEYVSHRATRKPLRPEPTH